MSTKEKLSTKNIPEAGSGGTPKVIQPGNVVVKINEITLEPKPFDSEAEDIMLHCETEPIQDFEGFFIDKDSPEKGRHLGQVGKVRATEWFFKDAEVGGSKISRETEIQKWVLQFCKVIGKTDWLDSQDMKHETAEQLVEQMNKDRIFDGVWLSATLAGKTYVNKQGFVNYDLYLPKFTNKSVPLEIKGTQPSKLIKFNTSEHIKVTKSKKEAPAQGSGSDFDLP